MIVKSLSHDTGFFVMGTLKPVDGELTGLQHRVRVLLYFFYCTRIRRKEEKVKPISFQIDLVCTYYIHHLLEPKDTKCQCQLSPYLIFL